MAIFSWTLAVISLIGVILNLYKIRACFYLWVGTNAAWMAVDFYFGIYAQSALFATYMVLAVIGIVKWKRDAERDREAAGEQEILIKRFSKNN